MQFETIGGVSVCNLWLEIRWKIDDIYGTKWAFFDAYATPNAQPLRDEGDFGLGRDFDT